MSGRSKDWLSTIMHTWCDRHIPIALCHVSPPYCWMEWLNIFAYHKSLLSEIYFLQNRKKGVLRVEERLDGKAAKRFLALPLTHFSFSPRSLLPGIICFVFTFWMIDIVIFKYFRVYFTFWAEMGEVWKYANMFCLQGFARFCKGFVEMNQFK